MAWNEARRAHWEGRQLSSASSTPAEQSGAKFLTPQRIMGVHSFKNSPKNGFWYDFSWMINPCSLYLHTCYSPCLHFEPLSVFFRFLFTHFSIASSNLSSPLLRPLSSSWPIPQLEPSQIRLIVYQDCERRGRNVLFDSNAKKRGTEETPISVSHMVLFWCSAFYCRPSFNCNISCSGLDSGLGKRSRTITFDLNWKWAYRKMCLTFIISYIYYIHPSIGSLAGNWRTWRNMHLPS